MAQNNANQSLGVAPNKKLAAIQTNGQGYVLPAGSVGAGNAWFVNETTGNDNGSGSAASPFATLGAAQSAATANNGDAVYVMGSVHLSAPFTWSKNGVSLVGLLSPSQNNRSRISVASGVTQTQVTALGTLMTVTAQGCSFLNIEGFHGFNGSLTPPTSPICWAELGGRNHYGNCQFLGGGDALTAAIGNMRSLVIGGQGENVFEDCVVGLDTEPRATNANASLEVIGHSPRNIMRRPLFRMYSSLATNVHILIGSGGEDRDLTLFGAMLINQIASGATGLNAAVSENSSAGGAIIFDASLLSVGATAVAASGNVYIAGSAIGATTTGIAILAT